MESRVLLLWLDGYDAATATTLMAEGRLPALARLRQTSARFALERAPAVRGLVNWGMHDPGTVPTSRPEGLRAEIEARFGPYPTEWIYGHVWNSAARAAAE